MMKIHKWHFLLVFLVPFILLGCGSNTELEEADKDVVRVSVSENSEMGTVNGDFFVVYEDTEDDDALEVFEDMLDEAIRREGIVDIALPEFDLEVVFEDGSSEGYHLWVGEIDDSSTLMKIEDTHTIYSIPVENTIELKALLK